MEKEIRNNDMNNKHITNLFPCPVFLIHLIMKTVKDLSTYRPIDLKEILRLKPQNDAPCPSNKTLTLAKDNPMEQVRKANTKNCSD